jgi:hypothetical protein
LSYQRLPESGDVLPFVLLIDKIHPIKWVLIILRLLLY